MKAVVEVEAAVEAREEEDAAGMAVAVAVDAVVADLAAVGAEAGTNRRRFVAAFSPRAWVAATLAFLLFQLANGILWSDRNCRAGFDVFDAPPAIAISFQHA